MDDFLKPKQSPPRHSAPRSTIQANILKPTAREDEYHTISIRMRRPKLQKSLVRGNMTKKISGYITKYVPYSIRRNRHIGAFASKLKAFAPSRRRHPTIARFGWGMLAILMLSTLVIEVFNGFRSEVVYAIDPKAEVVLDEPQALLGEELKLNATATAYEYNKGYAPVGGKATTSMSPKFTATFSTDPKEGSTLTDPMSGATLTLKPRYTTATPQKQQNRLVYPLRGYDGHKIETLRATSTKEDIILNTYQGDALSFSYDLELSPGTEARMEDDGSIGIYGGEAALLGQVATGTEQDQALLAKAREKSAKTTLLFRLPAPFIKDSSRQPSSARAWYGLKDMRLTIYTEGLKKAQYPLSIDPTIYIDSAARLMMGNNESNIDFDVDNQLIQKGKTTGGRFDQWNTSLALPSGLWRHATAVYGGYIYVVGGNTGSTVTSTLYWARINSSTGAIEAANPGNGACSGWCTLADYNLPAARQSGSLVAYNGYLYMLGGNNGTSSQSTVYVAKLGANGEPQLWRPTTSDPTAYWYESSMTLPSAGSFLSAVAFNNRLYLHIGTNALHPTGTGSDAIYMADILPTGKIYGSNQTTWFSLATLPASRHSLSLLAYNDKLYAIGGATGTTTQSTVYYSTISASDGTLSSWNTTTPISTTNGTVLLPRASSGGSFVTIWGGFIYVAGGCSALNASGYCTSVANDVQLGSINADGTLTDWTAVALQSPASPNTAMSYGFMSWRNRLYSLGGCAAQNITTGACTTIVSANLYANINPDGDVSTVSTSTASGVGSCSGTNPTDCDLPPQGDRAGESGRMAGGTVISNGFIYYMGGCTAVSSGSVCFTGNAGKASNNVSYAAIDSVGNIIRIPACTGGTFVGSWCVQNNGLPAYIAAFSVVTFNNRMFLIGGTDGSTWQSTVYSTSLNDNGTWGTWTTQTFAALNLGNAKGYTFAFTRANPAAAATAPGNLYVIGGCSGVTANDTGLDCTGTLYTGVYKCSILTSGLLDTTNTCTTTGQLQLDSEPGTPGAQGLGVMAGTVYANYVYMIGGQSPNESERGSVLYAKIDNSNNIVAVSGSEWIVSPYGIDPVRRRGLAFGYNGYLYALAGYNSSGGGSLQDLLYAKINVSDGSINPFSTSTVTVSPRWDLRGAVNSGYVYAIGGCSTGAPPASCATMTGTVQTFQLYNNYSGSPKTYSAGSQYSTDRYGAGAVIHKGYMYLAGGCTTAATDCTTATTNVMSAPLNPDGTLGTWTSTGVAALPAARTWGKLLSAGNALYFIGGQASGSNAGVSDVYYATPGNGTISSWSTGTSLPAGRTQFGAAVWDQRLYVVGGNDASGSPTATVYVSSRQPSGGNISSWDSASTNFSVSRSGLTAITYANNLYVLGGTNGTQYLNDVQFSKLDSTPGGTGRAGSWSATTSLPANISQADGFAANGFMYLFGGRSDATTCRLNTIVAPISANTTIASGNNPTGIGEWYATNVRYSGARYGANALYSQGKAYVLGGQCNGTMITTTNRVQQSSLQSQPQIAKYSRMIDTDKDVFPSVWLMNGLDNSTGARWFMRYRTMTDPLAEPWDGTGGPGRNCSQQQMTTWGQETNFGEVTLGKVESYISLDGSGNVTNGGGAGGGCARYYYLSVTIDSQQAYGYPEDVTRGPTIADLSLYFTASPGQRLLHGKTFNAGEQQPLDTPCRQSNNGSDPLYASCPLP